MLDWIVCLGAERPVADMQVHCPSCFDPAIPDAQVSVEDCLNCRHLLTTSIDRMPRFMCDVDWTSEAD